MEQIGKILIIIGVISVLVGLVFILGAKIPFLGRLPGDICIKKDNFSFYFPLTTSIIISIILSFIFWIFRPK
jgi:hypothetical protein